MTATKEDLIWFLTEMSIAREEDYLYITEDMIQAVKDFYDTYITDVKQHEEGLITVHNLSMNDKNSAIKLYIGYLSSSEKDMREEYVESVFNKFRRIKYVQIAELLSSCGDIIKKRNFKFDSKRYIFIDDFIYKNIKKIVPPLIKLLKKYCGGLESYLIKLPNTFQVYRCITPRNIEACKNVKRILELIKNPPKIHSDKEYKAVIKLEKQLYDELRKNPVIDFNKLGVFWTYIKRDAKCYQSKGGCHLDIIVEATIEDIQVDWLTTLMINISNVNEKEIRIKKKEPIIINNVYYKKGNNLKLLSTGADIGTTKEDSLAHYFIGVT